MRRKGDERETVRQSCFQGDVISKGDCIALCQCALLGQDAKIDVSITH
jgi:hypothetical protein